VFDTDTPESIEDATGVTWARILATNRLTPFEALRAGTELLIPASRARPTPIRGLPTFGSHKGTAAWGTDLRMEMTADASGDFEVVGEDDCLLQGVDILVGEFAEYVLEGVNEVPPSVRERYLADRLQGVLRSDPRIASIQEIGVELIDGAFDVQVAVVAINGGTIRTGGA